MFKLQFNLSSLAQVGDTFIEMKNHSQERLWDFRYAIPDWQTLKTTVGEPGRSSGVYTVSVASLPDRHWWADSSSNDVSLDYH